MKMLRFLWKNLWNGIVTLRFPARPPVQERYRGRIQFDPERCTGCAMCRFRCTSGAIQFAAAGKQFTWSYNPGQCTFCGRCVEGCKDHALSQESDSPPLYEAAGALKISHTLQRKTPPPKSQAAPASPAAQPGGAS
jgi:formate hydrogenlyase subunit 6